MRLTCAIAEGEDVPSHPPVNQKMPMEFANNDRSQFTVIESSPQEIKIELVDESRWRMTPLVQSDPPVGSRGVRGSNWVVREKLNSAR